MLPLSRKQQEWEFYRTSFFSIRNQACANYAGLVSSVSSISIEYKVELK